MLNLLDHYQNPEENQNEPSSTEKLLAQLVCANQTQVQREIQRLKDCIASASIQRNDAHAGAATKRGEAVSSRTAPLSPDHAQERPEDGDAGYSNLHSPGSGDSQGQSGGGAAAVIIRKLAYDAWSKLQRYLRNTQAEQETNRQIEVYENEGGTQIPAAPPQNPAWWVCEISEREIDRASDLISVADLEQLRFSKSAGEQIVDEAVRKLSITLDTTRDIIARANEILNYFHARGCKPPTWVRTYDDVMIWAEQVQMMGRAYRGSTRIEPV